MRIPTANLTWILVACLSTTVPAQGRGSSELTYSSPLEDFTLEGLFPVRADTRIDESIEVGKSWQKQAEELRLIAREREQKVLGAIAIKKSEMDTLQARVKQAKKTDDYAERSATAAQLKTDETTIDVLDSIRGLTKYEQRFADAWLETGKALEQWGEIETTVAQNRRKVLDQMAKQGIDGTKFRGLDSGLASHHKDLNAAYGRFGSDLAKMGNILQEYAAARKKVLEKWQGKR